MSDSIDQIVANAEADVAAVAPVVDAVGTVVAAADPAVAPVVDAGEAVVDAAEPVTQAVVATVPTAESFWQHIEAFFAQFKL
jgi:glycerate kinase